MPALGSTLLTTFAFALIVGDIALVVAGARVDPSSTIGGSGAIDIGAALSALGFTTAGLVLSTTGAGRRIGGLLLVTGAAIAVTLFSSTYAYWGLSDHLSLPGLTAFTWIANSAWLPVTSLLLFFLPALFPDGRLPSPAWRWVGWVSVGVALAGYFGMAFLDGPMQPPLQDWPNPLGLPVLHTLTDALVKVGYLGSTLIPFAGTVAVAIRYRRAGALQRAQLRWFIASIFPLVVGFAATSVAYNIPGLEPVVIVGTIVVILALIGVPIAIGIAILRYRLYDIDLLVNRTVLYGSVTVILAAALIVANVAAQRLVTAMSGERSELVAAALGVSVALLYGPTQRRLRPLIDRVLPGRAVMALLFTDIVGSTERILELGDEHWREVLDRYRSVVRQDLARWRGREINTAGDAFFAVFDRPMSAVHCAWAIRSSVASLGLECRTGVHVGQVELRGEQVSGLAVHAAARVMGAAAPGEILVSDDLRSTIADQGLTVADRGRHVLKGLPEEWQLYAVESASPAAT
jgi:class 3 adenylate cyclase